MNKLLFALAAVFALLAGVGLMLPNFSVRVPEATIQTAVDAAMPVAWERMGVDAAVKAATVGFEEDGVIALAATGNASGFAMNGTLAVDARTTLRFDNGAFYLSGLRLDDLTVVPDAESAEVIEGRRALLGAWKDRAANILGAGDGVAVEAGRAELERLQTAIQEGLTSTLEASLASTPVYRLEQAPGLMGWAALAVADVAVDTDAVVVTLSPSGFLGALALRAVVYGLAFLAALGMVGGFFLPTGRSH